MLSRQKKEQQVAELADIVATYPSVIFSDFSGMSTPDMDELRSLLREKGVAYKVTKKSLWPFVQKKVGEGHSVPAFDEHTGSVGIAYGSSADGIDASKLLARFAKEHEALVILGGIVGGELVNAAHVAVLASLPSREELVSALLRSLAAPLRGLVAVLSGPQRQLVNVLQQVTRSK